MSRVRAFHQYQYLIGQTGLLGRPGEKRPVSGSLSPTSRGLRGQPVARPVVTVLGVQSTENCHSAPQINARAPRTERALPVATHALCRPTEDLAGVDEFEFTLLGAVTLRDELQQLLVGQVTRAPAAAPPRRRSNAPRDVRARSSRTALRSRASQRSWRRVARARASSIASCRPSSTFRRLISASSAISSSPAATAAATSAFFSRPWPTLPGRPLRIPRERPPRRRSDQQELVHEGGLAWASYRTSIRYLVPNGTKDYELALSP